MAEEKTGLEIDDWLDDLAEVAPEELGQSDIDALLGGEKAEVADSAPAQDAGALDQSNIDSLFANGSQAVSAEVDGEDLGDLDQSDIDSLFSSGKEAEAVAEPAAESGPELNQSDIDNLFAAQTPAKEAVAAPPSPPAASAEDEFAQLFADSIGTGEQGVVAAAVAEEERIGSPDAGQFNDDEFDFGELPDIPDDEATVGVAAEAGAGGDPFAASLPDNVADFFGEKSEGKKQKPAAPQGKAEPAGTDAVPPAPGGKKKMLAIAAGVLLLLAGGGGGTYWYLSKSPQPVEPAPVPEKIAEVPQPVIAPPIIANAPPVAGESRWRMSKANEALEIELTGSDDDNDPLTFEMVTQPQFGRLSGELPKVTYLPNKDFPGEDSFEFKVSDGKEASAPVKVGIMGPEGLKPVTAEAAKEAGSEEASSPEPAKPAKKTPVVLAKNLRLNILSTEPLTIDWKKIWGAANRRPFGPQVVVEILSGPPRHGVLRSLDQARHIYEPDRYGSGREIVRYRFKAGGLASKAAELTITVTGNDKPPSLALKPVADSYRVGEKVVLDAGATRDDSPGALRFAWRQVSGAPVLLEKLGGEGSAVSFVVPSSFRGEQAGKIIIRLTATDAGGQQAGRDIVISAIPRRQTTSALWAAEDR